MLEFRVCVCRAFAKMSLLACCACLHEERESKALPTKKDGRTGKTFVFKIKLCRGEREGGKLAWDREGERGVGWG